MKNYLMMIVVLFSTGSVLLSENIDPYNSGEHYAWSENTGWVNFEPAQGSGIHVYSDRVEGYAWCENIGWVNLSPESYGGVANDGNGSLSGYAWSENAGWINFAPAGGGVSIDQAGVFSGWAWGENIGWINFGISADAVRVCRPDMEDLRNFINGWLTEGAVPANLDGEGFVDNSDYSIFASYWLGYCPDGWQLK